MTEPMPAGGQDADIHTPKRSTFAVFFENIFLAMVILSLGAIAFAGHRLGWKAPKFSRLWNSATEKVDWCESHHVPESICIECDEKLLPRGKAHGWCSKHGIPECPLCHPDAATLEPKDLGKLIEQGNRGLAFLERKANNPICKSHQRRIQFASLADVDKAGISVEPVWTGPMVESISAPGEIIYDQTRLAHLGARSSGTVWRVLKHLGEKVTAGETLALVDSAEVGKAKSELLQMLALSSLKTQTLGRLRNAGLATPGSTLEEAEAALRESLIRVNTARQTLVNLGLPVENLNLKPNSTETLENSLHFLGLPAEVSRQLDPARTTRNLLPVVSPIDGVIVSREVVAGEVVDASRILFEVVDNNYKWMTLDMRNEDARFLHLGQKVKFAIPGTPEEIDGQLSWISTQADLKTRTVKARVNLEDTGGKLRANTFGTGRIILREEAKAICIPKEALHWEGCCQVVFVRDRDFLSEGSPKVFHVRKVRAGVRDDRQVEILAGLLPGELVVSQGSGLLLTELLSGNLGASCACHAKK